jgi:outer membrane lipoprotein-sorting protein
MRGMWKSIVIIGVILTLVGCGSESATKGDVRSALEKKVVQMKGYQGKGKMTFHTGQSPLVYEVEVAYRKPDTYRVAMKNRDEKVDQIILKNKQGVYVITPSLKKSFRFQTNWPKNQGQVYLYQTIVENSLDETSTIKKEKNTYRIEGESNYPNETLARQIVWLNQQTLAPLKVEVYDRNEQLRVTMKFNQFKFDPKFDRDYFTQKRSLEVYEWSQQIR